MLSRTSRSAATLVSRRALSTRVSVAAPRLVAGAKRTVVDRSAFISGVRSFSASPLARDVETIKVPSMAESITEGTLKQWLKQPGDYVEADEEIATIETDKIDIAVNAPKSGTMKEHLAAEEDTVTVGQDLFKFEAGAAPEGGASKPKEEEPKEDKKEATKEEPKKDEGKTEAPVPKTQNEESNASQSHKKESTPPPPPSASKPQPAATPAPQAGSRNETRVKMSRMRQRIGERLKQSQNEAASLTTFNEIDMSSLMSMRAAYKDKILKDKGIKLGFMSAFAKASCIALKEIPAANASIEGDQIVYRDFVDLSVAVATPKGLVTPVLRNAEGMSFLDIEAGIVELGKKARDNKLTLEDMAGGSFTISNGGVFGSLYGTPIINSPQAAVLGMHSIKEKAWVVDGKIVIRPIMVVALTYDHRLLDGREAVTFLVRIKELIEDPRLFNLA